MYIGGVKWIGLKCTIYGVYRLVCSKQGTVLVGFFQSEDCNEHSSSSLDRVRPEYIVDLSFCHRVASRRVTT